MSRTVGSKVTPEHIADIVRLSRDGMRTADVARAVGLSERTVAKVRLRHGIIPPPRTRLTDDDIATIERLTLDGVSAANIGERVGCSESHVCRIRKRLGLTRDPVDDAVTVEDLEWLLSVGEHPDRIARRLGRSLDALAAIARRNDRPDLAAPLYAETGRMRRAS